MNPDQQQPQPLANANPSIIPIENSSIETSIRNLIRRWNTRRRQRNLIGDRPWRNKLANFLESNTVHAISMTLLLLDLIFTILELSFSLLSCSSKRNETLILCVHWLGISVLVLIAARMAALAVALGGAFLRRPGYLIDTTAVVGALLLEGFLEGKGGGLIMVVSLWRVVRVVESAFELSDEAIEAQIADIVRQFEALRAENMKLVEIISEKDQIIEKLQQELDSCRCS